MTNRLSYSCAYDNPVSYAVDVTSPCTNAVIVTHSPPSGVILHPGQSANVVVVASNAYGSITTNFTMTVMSNLQIIGADYLRIFSCTPTNVTFNVIAINPCCGNEVSLVCTPASGFVLAPGTMTNVVCVASDCENNLLTNTFPVFVVPLNVQLVCPTNKTVPYDSNWSFDAPTVVTGCCTDTNIVTALPWVTNLSGAFTISEVWVVTNSCGESDGCQQVVTLDFSGSFGGVASADSGDFTLDTTGTLPGTGGVASADSDDFTLDTTGTLPGVGSVAQADSLDFILDTTGASGAYADSLDLTLDTRGLVPFLLMNPLALPGGAFQFNFTNAPGVGFGVYGVTNLALPFSNWMFLGTATENPPGQYQFTDPQGSNYPQRFYRVISP